MSYDIVSPPTLENFLAAIMTGGATNPLDSESPNVLGAVDRQTRQFLYDYLNSIFTADGKVKAGSIDASTLLNSISGSLSNSPVDSAMHIVQGTISTPDFRAGAVDTNALASFAVTGAKIANGAVGTSQLADNAVTAAKLADNAVDTAAVQDGAVTTAKIANNAIDYTKITVSGLIGDSIALGSLLPTHLHQDSSLAAGRILCTDASGNWQAVQLQGDATIAFNGWISLTTKGTLVLKETCANGVGAMDSTTFAGLSTPIIRGKSGTGNPTWTVDVDPLSFLNATPSYTDGKIFLKTGIYFIQADVPAYGVGNHRAGLCQYSGTGTPYASPVWGINALAATGHMSVSTVTFAAAFSTGDYLQVLHLTQNAVTNGCGLACSFGTTEVYSLVRITRIG